MKAWEYGPIDAAGLVTLVLNKSAVAPNKLSLSKDQSLVEVITAGINPVDYKIHESGWLGRNLGMAAGATPGLDFCGRVVATHASSTALRKASWSFEPSRWRLNLGRSGNSLS